MSSDSPADPRAGAAGKVARASRLRVGEGVPPRCPHCPGGGTPPEPAGKTPALRLFPHPCPAANAV